MLPACTQKPSPHFLFKQLCEKKHNSQNIYYQHDARLTFSQNHLKNTRQDCKTAYHRIKSTVFLLENRTFQPIFTQILTHAQVGRCKGKQKNCQMPIFGKKIAQKAYILQMSLATYW